jgi:hypothetical protein
VDVTSASGLSRYVKLHRYFPGAVVELAEQRKALKTLECGIREGETDLYHSGTLGLLWTRSPANVSDDSRDGGRRTGCT